MIASSLQTHTPLQNTALKEVVAKSFYLSDEVADIYATTLEEYQQANEVVFDSLALKLTANHLFGSLFNAQQQGNGITYNPTINGKPIYSKPLTTAKADVKTVSVTDYLQEKLKDIGSRDEAWVKKTYSLKDTPKDLEFMAKMAEDYRHMTEFTKRLIIALNMATDDEKNKNAFSKDLLNVVV